MWQAPPIPLTDLEKKESGTHDRVCLDAENLESNNTVMPYILMVIMYTNAPPHTILIYIASEHAKSRPHSSLHAHNVFLQKRKLPNTGTHGEDEPKYKT